MSNHYTSWVSTMPVLHIPMINWDDFNTWSINNNDLLTPSLISTEMDFDLFSFQTVSDSSLTNISSSPSPSGSVDSWLSQDGDSENIDINQNNSKNNTSPLVFSTNRPYVCCYCQRTFSRRHDLERHTRVHTGVKPYNCPACNKSFSRSDARRRHWKSEAQCNTNHLIIDLLKKRTRKSIN